MTAKFAGDKDEVQEDEQFEETHESVVDQRQEDALDEEATIESVQKSTEMLSFATPRASKTREATRDETVSSNEILTVADDDSHFYLHDAESGAVRRRKTKVRRGVEFVEHEVMETEDVPEEILLQELQTVVIVQKTSDECTELTVSLPQRATHGTDTLGSHRQQETYADELLSADDLLTLDASRKRFTGDESSTINIVAEQLRHIDSPVDGAEEIEFVVPVVAWTETAIEDKDGAGADSSDYADESALVTNAEKEACLKPEQQTNECFDTQAQPKVPFDEAVSTVELYLRAGESGELPDEGTLEETKSYEHQRQVEDKQLPQETVTGEEDRNAVEDVALIVIERREDSQPFVTVKSASPLVCELDETEMHEIEVAESLQCEMVEGATARRAVVAEAIGDVFAIGTDEKLEKSDETVEEPLIHEPRAENAEQETETIPTYYLTDTETSATELQEETTHVTQRTETVYDDQTKSEFEIMLPTTKPVLTHPITDDIVEGCLMHVEVTTAEVEERGMKAAEETRHVRLLVGNKAVGSSQVEMMLPVNEDETRDSATVCVEEDEKSRGKILSEAADANTVGETVPISAEIMHVEMASMHLEFENNEAVITTAENNIVESTEIVVSEVGTVSTDIQQTVAMTLQISEEEDVSVLNIWTDGETDHDDRVIGTLRPTVYEKESSPVESSKLSDSSVGEIVIPVKDDREHVELTTACSSEEAAPGQRLTEPRDIRISEERETMKTVIEEATTGAVVFSSSSSEHEVDLLVFHRVFDKRELAGIAADETATTFSHSEDKIVEELSDIDITYQEQTTAGLSLESAVAATQLHEARSETESTLTKSGNEVATTAPHSTDNTCDSVATMQYVPTETEASQIVFPTLVEDDSVPDVLVSVDESALGDDSTDAIVDDVNPQLRRAPETPSHALADSAVAAVAPEMTDARCTVTGGVQSQLFVPYSSSVIVVSGDTNAHSDAVVVQRLSESVVDSSYVDSTHITQTHSLEQNERTLILNEKFLCDNLTVVFPESVGSSLAGDRTSSGDTETGVIDLPEQSLSFGSMLLTDAEEDELPMHDDVEQSQDAAAEATVIQMKLSHVDNTVTSRPEKPEFSETVFLDDNRTDSVRTGEVALLELVDKGDLMIRSPVLAACDDEVLSLKTDVQDSETLSDTDFVCEKSVDALSDGREIDKNWECSKPGESEEDAVLLSALQVSLYDGTLVQVVRAAAVCDVSGITAVLAVCDETDAPRTEEAVKPNDGNVQTECADDWQPAVQDDVTLDAVQTSETDGKILESALFADHATSSSVESLEDAQTQLFEASEISRTENECEMEKRATGCETSKLIAVDRKESQSAKVYEAVNAEATSCEPMTDGRQRRESMSAQTDETFTSEPQPEDEVKSALGLPWNLLFGDLLIDDGTTSAALTGEVRNDDVGSQGIEVESEKPEVERRAVSDDKPASSSAASKSSVVTRKVQRVSADGRVVERIKSEEVPMSFGPTSLAPYFFGGGADMPSPPDFSPQSDDRLPNSVKVYTDTVEGEPWTERRVEEVQEMRPDGATVTRKVVRVRKRRTIIKHIVIEGPEFEEIVLDEPATSSDTSRTEMPTAASNAEEDFQSTVDEQFQEPVVSDVDSTERQTPVEAIRSEDISHTGLAEAGRPESEQRCSFIIEKTDESALGSDSELDSKDMMSGLPVSLEISHACASSQEARHYGEVSEWFPPSDHGSSVGDGGPELDNVESASSCGDFATGILCYTAVHNVRLPRSLLSSFSVKNMSA